MYEEHWGKLHMLVCSVDFYGNSGGKLFGITGFKCFDRIITTHLAHHLDDIAEVKIRFFGSDGYTVAREINYTKDEFVTKLPEYHNFKKYGLSYINCDNDYFNSLPNVELCNKCTPTVGRESFFIAYQIQQDNLGLRPCTITSYYISEKGLTYILYDGAVKQSSNGGPLFSKSEGKLTGIVLNNEISLVNSYNDLIKNTDMNLESLNSVKGNMLIDGIDVVQVMMACQSQIKYMAKEFFHNFTTRHGYALDVEHLKEMLECYEDFDF